LELPTTITSAINTWLKKNKSKKVPAIVLGSSINGLSFARSLGRRGVPVMMLDNQQLLGSYSRYAMFMMLASPDTYADYWLTVLEWIASRLDAKAVLFTTSDAHCLLVAKYQKRLQSQFRFIVPQLETVEQILNKRQQYTIAQSAGIPIPKTYFPDTLEEGRELSQTLDYPCLLKPYTSYVGRRSIANQKVQVVNSATELVSAFERLNTNHAPFLVQEIIPGSDSMLYGYLSLFDAGGNELAWVSKKKLRQNPPGYGDGSVQITVDAPEMVQLSRQLLKTFNYRGFVNLEFKFDERDSTYRLIEINPRSAASTHVAISAGVDFPWVGYQHLLDNATSAPDFRRNITAFNEEWDLLAYLALRKTGALTFWGWLHSLAGAKPAIAAWDDPLPFIMGGKRLLQRFNQIIK
jgi:D-aspartate ligase